MARFHKSPRRRLIWRCFFIIFIPAIVLTFGAMLLNRMTAGDPSLLNVLNWNGLKSVRMELIDSPQIDHNSAWQKGTYFILSFSMFALVSLNTVLYVYDTFCRGLQADKESASVLRWLRWCWAGGCFLLLLSVVFLSVLVLVDEVFTLSLKQWLAIAFFAGFAVLDTLAYMAISRERTDFAKASESLLEGDGEQNTERRNELAREMSKCQRDAEYILKQAVYIDIPVVVGLVFVLVFNRQYLSNFDMEYAQAFAMGATVMHLATSQLLFAFVSFHDAWREYKQDVHLPTVLMVESKA